MIIAIVLLLSFVLLEIVGIDVGPDLLKNDRTSFALFCLNTRDVCFFTVIIKYQEIKKINSFINKLIFFII